MMSDATAPEPLDALLDKLAQGDEEAARQAFLTYEPYLRLVVRRHLSGRCRAKFDSMDIVQSVWADLLEGFRRGGWRFRDVHHLRAFLVKATRNRFLNRVRRHRRALECEQSLEETDPLQLPSARQAQPGEVAEADDLWDRLLMFCPPAHRELLQLKRQGLSLAELAARTGLHESSIRRIFYTLARRFAEQGHDKSSGRHPAGED
jgi:RNA polymerase sigma-70 factor (ECF subfamily)